eukprot:10598671-Lingulodinium_polyedra.AAC.1
MGPGGRGTAPSSGASAGGAEAALATPRRTSAQRRLTRGPAPARARWSALSAASSTAARIRRHASASASWSSR